MTQIDRTKLAKIVPTDVNWSREVQLDFYNDLDQWREITEQDYTGARDNGLPCRDYHEVNDYDEDAFLLGNPIEYWKDAGDYNYFAFVQVGNRFFARVIFGGKFPKAVARLRKALGK